MTQRRRRRPSRRYMNQRGQPPPPAEPAPVFKPEAEDVPFSEQREMPARPEDMGGVVDPSLFKPQEKIAEPPRDELDDLIDSIISDAEEQPATPTVPEAEGAELPPLFKEQAKSQQPPSFQGDVNPLAAQETAPAPPEEGPPVFLPQASEQLPQSAQEEDLLSSITTSFPDEELLPSSASAEAAEAYEESTEDEDPTMVSREIPGYDSPREEEVAEMAAVAQMARMAGPNVLPLSHEQTLAEKDDTDSIVYALGAFADLQPGQVGALRVSLRAIPNFNATAKSWLAAVKMGESPDEKKSLVGKVFAWMKYIGSKTVYDIRVMGKEGSQMEPPRPPSKRGQGVKPIPASQVSADEKEAWKAAEKKARDTTHFEAWVRSVVVAGKEDEAACHQISAEVMGGLEMFDSQFGNQKIVASEASAYDTLAGITSAREPDDVPMILSAAELAAIAHIPDDHTHPHGINVKRSRFKTIPVSTPLFVTDPYSPPDGIIPIGIQDPNSEDAKIIGMRNADLDRHMLLVGKTGSGKSELMKWLMFGAAKANYPIVLVDPHGQLSDEMLKTLLINCPERADDIVYCDLSDSEFPVGFNPLDIQAREMIEPTVSSVKQMLQAFMNLDASSAPRATSLAGLGLTALCEANLALRDEETKCTLLDMLEFFTNQEFRQQIVQFSENHGVRTQFNLDHGPFEQQNERTQADMVMPITRAFTQLAESDAFSAVFSSGKNKLDLGGLIAQRKIVLVQLARFASQAQLGEFVGTLIVPWLLQSMDFWGRKKDKVTGEYTRDAGCRLFVDEAPRVFSGDRSVPDLLAEARKWDLGLVMAAQFIEQFPSAIVEASLNNTGSKIGLSCDPKAAAEIAKAIGAASKQVTATDLAQMPNFHYYGNIMLPDAEGGLSPSGAFSAKCLPPINFNLTPEIESHRQSVVDASRQIICNPIAQIREKQNSRVENIQAALMSLSQDRRSVDFPQPEDISPGEVDDDGGQRWTM